MTTGMTHDDGKSGARPELAGEGAPSNQFSRRVDDEEMFGSGGEIRAWYADRPGHGNRASPLLSLSRRDETRSSRTFRRRRTGTDS